MIKARSGSSSITTTSGKVVLVSDTTITKLIGLDTYVMLHMHSPDLYKEMTECSYIERKYSEQRGQFPGVTDFKDFFLDSDYTPINLKEDLIRMCVGEEPHNPDARKFVNSSLSPSVVQCSGSSWFVFLIIMIAFWITLVYAVLDIYKFEVMKVELAAGMPVC